MNVTAIRKNLDMSQSVFSSTFNLVLRTLQDWEQNRSQPTGAARTLLKVLEANPQAVVQALAPETFKADFDMNDYFSTSDPAVVEHRMKLAIASNAIEGFEETKESTEWFESLPDNISDDEFIEAFKKHENL